MCLPLCQALAPYGDSTGTNSLIYFGQISMKKKEKSSRSMVVRLEDIKDTALTSDLHLKIKGEEKLTGRMGLH